MSVISRFLGAAAVGASVLLSPVVIPSASAAPCPDVEVVFARGTFEPPGVGDTGQAFVDALRAKVGDKSVDVYPVNYPASLDFSTAADGIIDATNKIRDMAASCPDTEMVLGGGQAFASSLLGEKLKILRHRACNGSDEQLATSQAIPKSLTLR